MDQIAVDKANHRLGNLRLRREGVAKPHLYIFIIAKTAGYGKDHSEDGHNGKKRGIGKRRGLVEHALGGEEADCQKGSADNYLVDLFQFTKVHRSISNKYKKKALPL